MHGKWIIALAAIAALAGCAAGDGSGTAASGKAPIPSPSDTGRADCFYAREVESFHVLDRSNLIVYAPGESRAYHVRISPPSVDLRNTERLAFIGTGGRVCGYAGERLVVGSRHSGPPLAIIGVFRLTPEGLEALRPTTGKGAGAAPAPQPGDGPDIEDITESTERGTGNGGGPD